MTDDTQPQNKPKRLTRSSTDTVIGGVAGGLARYFSLDPILFRVGFVALTFLGGFGVLAYLGLLAFVPSDDPDRGGSTSRVAAIVGAVVLGLALVTFLDAPFFVFGPGLLVLGILALAGVLLWRALGGEISGDPARIAVRVALATLLAIGVATFAVGVGVAAALGGGVVIASLAVVAGLALIATAFTGGARWMIVPALALVLPLGIVAAADLDFDGGIGDRDYRPASITALRDHYEIGIGDLMVDLRDLDLPAGRTDLAVDVGLGDAVVYVPSDACVTSDLAIGAGAADVLDRDHHGVDVAVSEQATAPAGRPHLHIDADLGVGVIEVVREGFRRDGFDHDGFDRGRFRFDDGELDDGFDGTRCA
jgi:phage shock protein PspC (stress-responsive transcriptional regulator)